MVPEEEGGNEVWLDGDAKAPSPPAADLGAQARNMIQGQRQYYDMVHVVKEQASLQCTVAQQGVTWMQGMLECWHWVDSPSVCLWL